MIFNKRRRFLKTMERVNQRLVAVVGRREESTGVRLSSQTGGVVAAVEWQHSSLL